ncbi:MAG: hypothetical protein EBR82_12180 [Caulobacteraceae bacterium]|nr:hypothetical protein [Caulobacteraceae bacterium]
MPLSTAAQAEQDYSPSDTDWLASRYTGAWANSDADPNQWAGDADYDKATTDRWKALNNYQFENPGLSPEQQALLGRAKFQNDQARQQQQQMYDLAQSWAKGGATPQQEQMRQGFAAQSVGTNAVANAATGGARGLIAARTNAGMQGAQDAQFNALALQQQKARDQQMGQQMMMQAANQMRQQDIENFGAANQYALQNEQDRLAWQKMNDANKLYYGNMLDNQSLAMAGIQLEGAEQQQQLSLQDQARREAQMQGGLSAAAGAFEYGAKAWGDKSGEPDSGSSGKNLEVPSDDEGSGLNSYGV